MQHSLFQDPEGRPQARTPTSDSSVNRAPCPFHPVHQDQFGHVIPWEGQGEIHLDQHVLCPSTLMSPSLWFPIPQSPSIQSEEMAAHYEHSRSCARGEMLCLGIHKTLSISQASLQQKHWSRSQCCPTPEKHGCPLQM